MNLAERLAEQTSAARERMKKAACEAERIANERAAKAQLDAENGFEDWFTRNWLTVIEQAAARGQSSIRLSKYDEYGPAPHFVVAFLESKGLKTSWPEYVPPDADLDGGYRIYTVRWGTGQ